MSPKPKDKELYADIKKKAKKKFKVYPSIYANSWLVSEYKKAYAKKHGEGKEAYTGKKPTDSGIPKWFDEEWIDLSRSNPDKNKWVECGRPKADQKKSDWKKDYPKCYPKSKAKKLWKDGGQKAFDDAVKRKRKAVNNPKYKGGKPTYVSTKKKAESEKVISNESNNKLLRKGVLAEAGIIGASLFAVGASMMQFELKGITDKKWWPYAGLFVAGASLHLIYEALGLNKKYCETAFAVEDEDDDDDDESWREEVDWDKKDKSHIGDEAEWDNESFESDNGYYSNSGRLIRPQREAANWGDSFATSWQRKKDKNEDKGNEINWRKPKHEINKEKKNRIYRQDRYFCERYYDLPIDDRPTYSSRYRRRGNRCGNCGAKKCVEGLENYKKNNLTFTIVGEPEYIGEAEEKATEVVIKRSTNDKKKLMAVFTYPDGKTRTTHFGARGMSDYTKHGDKERMERYLDRHDNGREDWNDPTTAGALSRWVLWNKPSLEESFNDFKKRFNLKGELKVKKSAESFESETITFESFRGRWNVGQTRDIEGVRVKKMRNGFYRLDFQGESTVIDDTGYYIINRNEQGRFSIGGYDRTLNQELRKRDRPVFIMDKVEKIIRWKHKVGGGRLVIKRPYKKASAILTNDGFRPYSGVYKRPNTGVRRVNTFKRKSDNRIDYGLEPKKNEAWLDIKYDAESFEADSCIECGRKEGPYSDTKLVACKGCPELCCQHCDLGDKGCKFCFGKDKYQAEDEAKICWSCKKQTTEGKKRRFGRFICFNCNPQDTYQAENSYLELMDSDIKKDDLYYAKVMMKALNDRGFQALIVGGAVRDKIMGKKPKDYDIGTSALPEEVEEVANQLVGFKYILGAEGEQAKRALTSLVIAPNGVLIEITTFRGEMYGGSRTEIRATPTQSFKEDSKRRDLTINSLGENIEGEVIDYHGGVKDIDNRIIRCVGNPDERFKEDALRMIRALRFAVRFNFKIEPKTWESIKRNNKLVLNLSNRRRREEVGKVLYYKGGFDLLMQSGILPLLVPETKNLQKYKHNLKYHPEGNLYNHYSKAFNTWTNLPNRTELGGWALLFHDIAKPETAEWKGDYHTFYGHDMVGAKLIKERYNNMQGRFEFSKKELDALSWTTKYHLMKFWEMKNKTKIANMGNNENFPLLLEVIYGDSMGMHDEEMANRILEIEETTIDFNQKKELVGKRPKDFAMRVFNELNIPKGTQRGEVLSKIEDLVMNGKAKDYDQALEMIKSSKDTYQTEYNHQFVLGAESHYTDERPMTCPICRENLRKYDLD